MSLTEEVEKRVQTHPLEKDRAEKSQALRNAYALAVKFRHIRPRTYSVPMEKFFGLPPYAGLNAQRDDDRKS